jgi:recombination protein RecA
MKDPVAATLARMQAKLGKSSAMLLSQGADSDVNEVIPTGIEVIDNYMLGVGGLPCGRLVEVYSDEGTGKTSFALQCLAGVQREGGVGILAETEHALDSKRAAAFGCDLERVILMQPDCIEHTTKAIETSLHSLPPKVPALIVWDSIAQTPTLREVEEGLEGDERIGERARELSKACRILAGVVAKKKATLLFVNQIRDKIGVMFGDTTTTPGGKGIKFYATIRIQMFSGKSVKDGKMHTGKTVTFMTSKNKVHPPWRKVQVRLDYQHGWDNAWSTINHAKDEGLIDKKKTTNVKTHKEALEALQWKPGIQSEITGTGEVETTDDTD